MNAWGETHIKDFIKSVLPPFEKPKENHLNDGYLFIDALALALALKDDGKVLMRELKKKWPTEVEASMQEATELAVKMLKEAE
jgi:hypothetical protein